MERGESREPQPAHSDDDFTAPSFHRQLFPHIGQTQLELRARELVETVSSLDLPAHSRMERGGEGPRTASRSYLAQDSYELIHVTGILKTYFTS